MYTGLLHTHRLLAYFFLLATVGLLFLTLYSRISGKTPSASARKFLSTFALITGHTQLLLGLGLYFVGPWFSLLTSNTAEVMKDADLRWFAVEHLTVNILGIVLLTIGHSRFKKAADYAAKDKAILRYFGLAFLLIASRIPCDRLF